MRPEIGAVEANVTHSLRLLEKAAAMGAQLVVLPELCNTGYVFQSRAEALGLAEPIPDGPTVSAWLEAARRLGLYIVAGIAERAGDILYNSAVVIGPQGLIGTFRKNHLWNQENLFFTAGDSGCPVFDTPLGRIAVAICYDIWFPEVFRMAALQGADILCVPTNWVPMADQPDDAPAMANILTMAGAHSNALFVAAADRVGTERGQPFIGRSLIVDHTGWPLAGPASADAEEIILAEVNLQDPRRKAPVNAFNHVLSDRRTDLYGDRPSVSISDDIPASTSLVT
jgi:predicted amidohydrolase